MPNSDAKRLTNWGFKGLRFGGWVLLSIINKNVNVPWLVTSKLGKFFTDCFEILTQRCIQIRGGTGCDGTGWDGTGLDETGRDGMGWD
jgi:hypothetical protein